MERFISLNLRDDSDNDRSLTANPPKQEEKAPDEVMKRLNMYANKAAHKAAKQYGRSGSGMFTK